MRRKENNNLVSINYSNGTVFYYTSMNRAACKLGVATASVKWAVEHGNVLTDYEGKVFTIGIVDGSEIPYKLINN